MKPPIRKLEQITSPMPTRLRPPSASWAMAPSVIKNAMATIAAMPVTHFALVTGSLLSQRLTKAT